MDWACCSNAGCCGERNSHPHCHCTGEDINSVLKKFFCCTDFCIAALCRHLRAFALSIAFCSIIPCQTGMVGLQRNYSLAKEFWSGLSFMRALQVEHHSPDMGKLELARSTRASWIPCRTVSASGFSFMESSSKVWTKGLVASNANF